MGNDNSFKNILKELKEINKDFPDIRFGLCIQSAIDIHKKKNNTNLHDYSSKVILKSLEEFHSETKSRRRK